MKARQIRFIAHVVRWFDRINGNTYHSIRIVRVRDNKTIFCKWRYGYADHYKQTAFSVMEEAKWLPPKYFGDKAYLYERENNYPIEWIVRDGLKREMVANGNG